MRLLKCIQLNEHIIDLKDGKQPPYKLIHSLGLIELETLKTYIETHLKTRFIQSSNSPTYDPILFNKKLDGIFRLCINYQGLNNLMIKNWYLLSLIRKLLNQLNQVKRFIRLDLTNAYQQMRIKEDDKWKTAF